MIPEQKIKKGRSIIILKTNTLNSPHPTHLSLGFSNYHFPTVFHLHLSLQLIHFFSLLIQFLISLSNTFFFFLLVWLAIWKAKLSDGALVNTKIQHRDLSSLMNFLAKKKTSNASRAGSSLHGQYPLNFASLGSFFIILIFHFYVTSVFHIW